MTDYGPSMEGATVSEATRCVCGHRWDDHYPAAGLTSTCCLYGGRRACEPHVFQPDEDR